MNTSVLHELVRFPTRQSRTEFVARRFAPYLQHRVLDVGCFEAPLRRLLPGAQYVGVDFCGAPDVYLDLDRAQSLPFGDKAFHCVICIEVLEHLDNLHRMFDELVRTSGRYVIVSLPNCWRDARVRIERGSGSFLHYGLPPEPPLDRHKWFFSLEQAQAFLRAKAAQHGLCVVEELITEQPRFAPLRWWRKLRYPGMRYHNRYASTAWVVLEKPSVA